MLPHICKVKGVTVAVLVKKEIRNFPFFRALLRQTAKGSRSKLQRKIMYTEISQLLQQRRRNSLSSKCCLSVASQRKDGETAQQLRVLTAFAEDLGWFPAFTW